MVCLMHIAAVAGASELNVRGDEREGRIRFVGDHDYYRVFVRYDVPWLDDPSVDGGVAIRVYDVEVMFGPLSREGIAKTIYAPLEYAARSDDHHRAGALDLERSIDGSGDYGVMASYDGEWRAALAGIQDEGQWQAVAGIGAAFGNVDIHLWSSYTELSERPPDESWYSDGLAFGGLDIFHNALVVAFDEPGRAIYATGMLQVGHLHAPHGAAMVVVDVGEKPHYGGGKAAWSALLYLDEHGAFNDEGLQGEVWYRYNPALYFDALVAAQATIYAHHDTFTDVVYDFGRHRVIVEGDISGEAQIDDDDGYARWACAVEYIIDNRSTAEYNERWKIEPSATVGGDEASASVEYALTIEDGQPTTQQIAVEFDIAGDFFEVVPAVAMSHAFPTAEINIDGELSIAFHPSWGKIFANLAVPIYPLPGWEDAHVEIGVDVDIE